MNSKLHTTLLQSIRSQEKWKFCIWHCPIFVESNRTVPDNFYRDFVRRILLQWDCWYSNKLCMVEQPHHNFLFSGYCRVPFPMWMEKRIVPIVHLLKYYFFRLSSRLLSKSFLDLVYSGMCLFRYIHIQWDNLKKQTNNTTFVNLRGALFHFILCDVNLSSEVRFDTMALGLL